jgi:hypothetical protein
MGRSEHEPEEGNAPAATLAAILDHCPADGDVIYAVWKGWGSWDSEVDQGILMPGWGGRGYRLYAGPKATHIAWPGMSRIWSQSANLIWPLDHSWCIATEIDYDSTLVACDETAAAELLTDPRLEAFRVSYDSDLSITGDPLNAE